MRGRRPWLRRARAPTSAPTAAAPRRARHQRRAARRGAQGAGEVRVQQRPVGGEHVVGRDVALAAPYARIVRIDVSKAWKVSGVEAIITAEDVPGQPTYGLISQDQPVFARDVVRYMGEPVAAVAADHPETCRRALAAIEVDYEVLEPLTDAEEAIAGTRDPIHPDGNTLRHQRIVHGDVGRDRRRGRRGDLRDRHAGSGVPRARGRARRPRPGRRRASSCTSPPSGCTRTASRSPPASGCRRTRCGSCSAASAARSAPARTSACRCTAACSRCAPVGR